MKISLCQIPADLIGYVRGLKRNGLYKISVHWPAKRPVGAVIPSKEIYRNRLIRSYAPLEEMVIRLTHFQERKIRFEIITSEKAYIFPADRHFLFRFKGIVYEALR